MDMALSIAEAAARKARRDHSSATVSILYARKDTPSKKGFCGSGFIIRLDEESCKVMTCDHVLRAIIDDEDGDEESDNYSFWVRLFHAHEDVEATVQFSDIERDLAILSIHKLPATSVAPTKLKFSKRNKIGTDVVLLGYFNPVAIEKDLLKKKSVIAKLPNAIPGKIVGPLRQDPHIAEMTDFTHSCYGISGCSGCPLISHTSGKVLGVFNGSQKQIHSAIATRTVKGQLRLWLNAENTTTLKNMIKML